MGEETSFVEKAGDRGKATPDAYEDPTYSSHKDTASLISADQLDRLQ